MKSRGLEDNRIGYLLKRVQFSLRSRMDKVLEPKGLTTPQYAVLSFLEHEPGASSAELARRSFVTPQTMIRIVENLETLGLIRREPHPTHGRVLMASLTPVGASAVTACHAQVNGVERQMLRRLSSHERATLRDLLLRCLDGMGSDES